MRCALSTAGPHPQRIAAGVRGVRTGVPQYDMYTTEREGNWRLTVKTDMVMMMMMMQLVMKMMAMEMAIARARELLLMLWADDQPTWGSLSLLSEPHDQPYPMQPYATKPLQFPNFTNHDTIPYKFPMVGAGDGAMGRGMPCQGHHTMVRLYNVRRVRHGRTC